MRHAPVHIAERRGALLQLMRDFCDALRTRLRISQLRRNVLRELFEAPCGIRCLTPLLRRASKVFGGLLQRPLSLVDLLPENADSLAKAVETLRVLFQRIDGLGYRLHADFYAIDRHRDSGDRGRDAFG